MKKTLFIALLMVLVSCKNDDDIINNPNLPVVGVNFQINLTLPQYNSLNFPGGIFVDRTDGRGIKGIIVYNLNDQQYFAYELSDPNIPPSGCSALLIEGTRASSNCDNDNVYDIASFGQRISGEGNYPLYAYRIRKEGNILSINN